jgi:hypothetical protein
MQTVVNCNVVHIVRSFENSGKYYRYYISLTLRTYSGMSTSSAKNEEEVLRL